MRSQSLDIVISIQVRENLHAGTTVTSTVQSDKGARAAAARIQLRISILAWRSIGDLWYIQERKIQHLRHAHTDFQLSS